MKERRMKKANAIREVPSSFFLLRGEKFLKSLRMSRAKTANGPKLYSHLCGLLSRRPQQRGLKLFKIKTGPRNNQLLQCGAVPFFFDAAAMPVGCCSPAAALMANTVQLGLAGATKLS